MKLHNTAINNLIRIFTTYGGHKGESKLREQLSKIDFSSYQQQSGRQVLVLTEELRKATLPQK